MKTNQMAVKAAEYEIITLPSGLTVQVRPMPGYSSVHAVYGTDFGSIDRFFTVDGKKVVVPEGTAHFLEHKMFESDEGDAFSLYAKTGAQANAFTSFEKTCYIFTATSQINESLDVLLGMVEKPYFTEQTIAKEQGIIGQEIKMYDDSPDWRMLTESMRCLYSAHPIRDDIAGTSPPKCCMIAARHSTARAAWCFRWPAMSPKSRCWLPAPVPGWISPCSRPRRWSA